MKILVGVTGCIAAYKAPDLISGLRKRDAICVSVIATEKALKFITKSSLSLAANRYWEEDDTKAIHIDCTDDLEVFLIAPMTANTLSKIVHGVADNLLTEAALALDSNVIKVFCPAMNTRMWKNNITQDNVKKLIEYGWKMIPPSEGHLACGTIGEGKLPPTKEIVDKVIELWGQKWHTTAKSQ